MRGSAFRRPYTGLLITVHVLHLWYAPFTHVQDIFLGRNRTIGARIKVATRHRHHRESSRPPGRGQSEVMMTVAEPAIARPNPTSRPSTPGLRALADLTGAH